MLHKAISFCILFVSILVLTACSGDEDEITDFLEPVDLRVASIQLGDGASLAYQGSPVLEFNPNNLGPYDIVLDDPDLTAISVTVVYDRASVPAQLSIAEYRKQDDNNRTQVTPISSGAAVELELLAGSNTFGVRVAHTQSSARIEYQLQLSRPTTVNSSELSNIRVSGIDTSNDENSALVQFDGEFASNTFTYNVTVDSTLCSVPIVPVPVGALSQVTIDGEPWSASTLSFVALDEGVVKNVPIVVTSADGTLTSTYTLNITRETATAAEIDVDNSLRSLVIAEGRPSQQPFFCSPSIGGLVQRVPASVDDVTLTAVTSRPGATMVIGRVSAGSAELDAEGREPLVSGEAYTGDLVKGLEVGRTTLGILVTAPNGEDTNTRTYLVAIDKTVTEEIFVSTAEELQQALRNAMPNDEIIVRPGDYVGLPSAADSETGSGSLDAHFYSAASGTLETGAEGRDEFITLTIESADVRLLGTDLTQNTVLKIAGDNWRIRGRNSSPLSLSLQLSGAQNGIVLDGTSNVVIESASITDVGERGVLMTNGATNNQIRGSVINKTGQSPVPRDGITEVYAEAVVIGGGEGVASGNAVRNMEFGRDIEHEVVDIKAGTELTDVQYNAFDLDSVGETSVASRSVIQVNASAEISFNRFDYNFITGSDNLPPELQQNPIARFVVSSPAAGEVVEVYENIVQLDGQSVPLIVGGGAGQTQAVANFVGNRSEGVAPAYTGSVDLNFAHPIYQIQSTLGPSKCLASRSVTVSSDTDIQPTPSSDQLAVMVDCANEPSQQWMTLNEGNDYMQVVLASDPAEKLQSARILNVFAYQNSIANDSRRILRVRTDALPADANFRLNAAFNLRWRISGHLGENSFINRQNNEAIAENVGLSVTNLDFDIEPLSVVLAIVVPSDGSFQFRQIRQ